MALNASLSTSGFELDRPFAGNELKAWLSVDTEDGDATTDGVRLESVPEVAANAGDVM